MQYGLLTGTDVKTIEKAMEHLCEQFAGPLTFIEIGVQKGDTSRGIAGWMQWKGRELRYFGVDNQRDMQTEPPFPGANLILGDSAEVFRSLTERAHMLVIDGCHCANHALLDFLNYSPLVVPGGLVLFHDWNPSMQGKPEHYQGHGPRGNPSFSCGVREAVEKLGLVNRAASWRLWHEAWEEFCWGGFGVFERRGYVAPALAK